MEFLGAIVDLVIVILSFIAVVIIIALGIGLTVVIISVAVSILDSLFDFALCGGIEACIKTVVDFIKDAILWGSRKIRKRIRKCRNG